MKAAYLTPAITLFHEDGSLDLESQRKLFENQAIDFSKNNQNKKYKKVIYTNALTFCES